MRLITIHPTLSHPSVGFLVGGTIHIDKSPFSAFMGLSLSLIVACTGCPATQSLPSQSPILELTEKHTQCNYLLYVPSIYTDAQAWPLVIPCHGTWPFDTAKLQMREWAKFAEYEGIIIAAPTLVSSKGDFPPPPEKQIRLQRTDERNILAMVSELKRRYNIAEAQVFLTGWSAGAYPILNTGLKHPDVFRAVFIRQGNFDERYMDVPDTVISKWQPIKMVYGKVDPLRDQTRAGIKWLRKMGLWVEEQEISGVHRRFDPRHTWRFFKKIVTDRPWIRIRAHRIRPDKVFAIHFELDTVPEAVKYKWFFGDGEESYDRSPIHTYKTAGRYQVRVNVALKGGHAYSRTKIIRISPSLKGL